MGSEPTRENIDLLPIKTIANANFPLDAEGNTYHVGTRLGQVASRIITVGDPHRAKSLALNLSETTRYLSKRGFLTITGSFKGTLVSIIAIGMGVGNADIMIREVRATVQGPILLVRFGSCGGIKKEIGVGMVSVANASVIITRNYDHFLPEGAQLEPYSISKPFVSDAQLTASIQSSLVTSLGQEKITIGLNATGDSFYSSQGRIDPGFIDKNTGLLETLAQQYPDAQTLEMETFILFHLSHCANPASPIRSAACTMVFANRFDNSFISPEQVAELELLCGKAVLEGILATSLEVLNN